MGFVATIYGERPNYRVEPTRETAHRFLLYRGRAAHAER